MKAKKNSLLVVRKTNDENWYSRERCRLFIPHILLPFKNKAPLLPTMQPSQKKALYTMFHLCTILPKTCKHTLMCKIGRVTLSENTHYFNSLHHTFLMCISTIKNVKLFNLSISLITSLRSLNHKLIIWILAQNGVLYLTNKGVHIASSPNQLATWCWNINCRN